MKKLLTILGVISLTSISAVSVVACSSKSSSNQPDDGDENQELITSLINQLTTTGKTIGNQATQISTLTTTNANLKTQLQGLVDTTTANQTQINTLSTTMSTNQTQLDTLIATNTDLNNQLVDLINSNVTNQDNIATLLATLFANQLQLRTLFVTQGSLSTKISTLTQQLSTANTSLISVRAGTSWKISTTDTTNKSLIRNFKNAATGQWNVEKWMLKTGTSYGLDRYINGIEFDPFGTWTANTTTTLNYFAQLGFKASLINGSTQWQTTATTTGNSSFKTLALSSDEQATALQNQLSVAKETISSNTGTISSLTTTNQNLNATITSLTTINKNQGDVINALNQDITTQTNQINSLTTTNNNLTTSITSLKDGNAGQSDIITTINDTITSQNTQIGTTSPSNNTLQIQVNDLTNQLATANTELTQATNSNGWVIDTTDTTNKTITRTYKNPNTGNWQTEKVIVATGGTTLNRTIDGTSYPYQNAMNANEGTAQTFFKSLGFNLVQVNSQWVFSILEA